MFSPNRIEGLQFGILSPEEIKDMSVVEVTKPLTFENGKPVPGGLNDLKMGPIERGEVCQSCWLDHYSCPGHFGHIDLVIPVLNVQFISNTRMGSSVSVKNILESICIACGKLLIDIPDGIEKIHYKKRLAYIKSRIPLNSQKMKECSSSTGCHYVQPNYSFGKYNECFFSYSGRESKERLRPEYILDLFSRIDNDTVRALGMNPDYCRPEWLIFTRLPVPPPALRPAIKSETAKHEDDLVVSFEQIIKINKQLAAALQQGNQKVLNWYEQLLNVYINSMISGKKVATGDSIVAFSTGGKPIKSIKDRLMNKDGRVRGNLSGKRVDFSGRTVITPDPTLALDQIGIPIAICMTLTFPEIVSEDNIEDLYRYVYNGPYKYPGANSIKDVSGVELLLKHIDVSSVVLKPGDIVERHLIKDDIVLFNRQPSLHKMSMMSHRIVPLPESTFRMSVNACTQYNADFDGDEMNIHLPRSKVTQEELRMIALVPNQMISPAKSRSITGILQDGLSAIYKSTVHNVPMSAKRFYNVLLADDMFNGVVDIHKDGIYYGKDIFSHILPPLNYHKVYKEPVHEFVDPLKNVIDQIRFNLFITDVDPDHISFQRVPDLQKKVSQFIKIFVGKYKSDKNINKRIIELLQAIDKKLLTNKPRGLKNMVDNLEKLANEDAKKYTKKKVELDIVQGKLNHGKIGRSHFKSGGGDYNFIYRTWEDFGPLAARDLVTKVQKTMDYWLISDGHTIGMGDMLVHNKDVRDEITMAILKSLEAYKKLEMDTVHENLIPGIGRTIEDEFETQSMQIFNDAFSCKVPAILSKYLKTVPNHMHNMVTSGAKGSVVNETQIMGLVGPIAIGGKRFPKSYGQRSLPAYQKYSNNATSRGFAANSFLNGLEPQEFFIQMASGREGCIDTAIKSVTGDTPIIIIENDKPKRVLIGDWIDNLLLQHADKVEHYTEREMELLKLTDITEITIPTSDLNGNVSWGDISAITRHDPGKELYKIKTHGGREVIVTESKSLLVWNKSICQFVRMNTPDVKIGDYVPTTMNLLKPSKIITHINVCDYLPKTECLYGTDFNIAKGRLDDSLSSKGCPPQGWWSDNNHKEFTLPYDHAHRLMRVLRRSNVSNIHDGYVYPYNSNRGKILIPEQFELNRDNGYFMGLYLAEGDLYIPGGYVRITNIDPIIIQSVKNWFAKYNISTRTDTKINHTGGTSTSTRASSVILAKLFDRLMSHGAENKHVPVEAFNAPDEFIIGLLDGYISGDGCITKNSIQVASASEELINGISMLCNRLGIFGKITKINMTKNNLGTENIKTPHMLSIRAQWATKFAELVELTHPEKFQQLSKMKASSSHRNFTVQNDVVLDKIVSIEPISIEEYPKVYDLTVPSTLNFGLANGLHVVDTAQSGYISRRLMKAMEDYMANYDCSVRNSMGRIIQFIYAGHGLDAVYCTHTQLTFIEQTYSDLVKNYLYTQDELKKTLDSDILKSVIDGMKILEDDYNRMVYYQKLLREYIYRAHTEADVMFMSPINLDIELLNVKTNFGLMDIENPKPSILDPVYVSRKINGLCSVIPQLYGNTSFNINKNIPLLSEYDWPRQNANDPLDVSAFFKHLQEKNDNYYTVSLLFCIYVRSYLSPKRVITEYHLTKDAFDYLINQIIFKYSRSIICPGEMVGSLAAQSIGEPTTQATLNSVDYKQRILVGKKIKEKGGKLTLDIKEVAIGKFVEHYLEYLKRRDINATNNEHLQYFDYRHERRDKAEYGQILNLNYYTISCDKQGNLRWNPLSGVSKHVPINEDGTNKLLKVTLSNGSVIRATAGHSFLMREPEGLAKKEGKDLKVGDLLPVMKDFPIDNLEELDYLDLGKYFPKDEFIWGSEMKKAEKVMREYNDRGDRHWFSCNNGKEFTIPFNRSDSARKSFETTDFTHESGYIYSKHYAGNYLPEKLVLDEDFGFLVGIYLAEGNLNGGRENKVMISNNDKRIRDKVENYVKRFNINCHTQIQENKIQEGWTSSSIIIHSAILATLIKKICGVYSDKKFVAPFMYNANLQFIKGVLSGYISGDGCVHSKGRCGTTITSVSKKLLDGIRMVLNRLNIISRIRPIKKKNNNLGTPIERIKQKYVLSIGVAGTIKLLNNVTLYKNYNDNRLETIKLKKCKYSFSKNDIIPNVVIDGKIVNIHRDNLPGFMPTNSTLKEIYDCGVYYSQIVKLEWVEPSNGFTYDITVHDDHTFVTNGILTSNTFHLSGVAAKSSVLSGIPRMEELFRVTKKIKTPMMDVFLDPSIMDNKYQAKIIANSIEHTVLLSFAKNIGIWFDPLPNNTVIDEDKAFVKSYFANTVGPSRVNLDRLSKFVIRVELDKHKTIYKQIRMNFLKHQLQKYKNGYFFIIHSDDNADKLILHIRMNLDNVTTKYTDELDLVLKSRDLVMEKIEIRGIKNVVSAQIDNAGEKVYVYNLDTGKREQKDQWIIYTDGTNLKYTLGQPGVDSNRVVTTDVFEISQVLGIEAGRSMLFKEFHDTYDKAVSTINYHHLSILVDIMTYNGHLMPISRHGINRTDNSPLTKASFEETQEQLAEAGVYGVLDNMKSVSACTMIAQTTRSGTCGPFDIIYDYRNKGITSDSLDFLLEQETEIKGDELDSRVLIKE